MKMNQNMRHPFSEEVGTLSQFLDSGQARPEKIGNGFDQNGKPRIAYVATFSGSDGKEMTARISKFAYEARIVKEEEGIAHEQSLRLSHDAQMMTDSEIANEVRAMIEMG